MAISSGERGTKSQQQDRRNAADRSRANADRDRGTKSQQQDRRNMDAARRAGNAAPGVGANRDRGTLSQQQDRINMNRALARSNTAPGVGNYSKAMDDYNNIGQGFWDDPLGAIGRMFGSGFGVGEIDPSTQAPKSFLGREEASWGIDPIGAALGIGGMFAGPAGTLASNAYQGIKGLTGWQGPMIAFDGNQPVNMGLDLPTGLTSPNIGQTPPSMAQHGGDGLLSPNFGAPTTPTQTATAPKPAAQPQAPGDLYKTLQAQYMPINARGLAEYGVWRPEHRFAA
jgi:hypothetical protein